MANVIWSYEKLTLLKSGLFSTYPKSGSSDPTTSSGLVNFHRRVFFQVFSTQSIILTSFYFLHHIERLLFGTLLHEQAMYFICRYV